jgi:hypothetical protein
LFIDIKEKKLDPDLDSDSKQIKWIIDAEPIATIAMSKIQPHESENLKKGEHLFHS